MGFSLRRSGIIAGLFLLLPLLVSAHATPTSYSPEPSSVLEATPTVIRIEYSERLDAPASSITVVGPTGSSQLLEAHADPSDPRMLSANLSDEGNGVYRVSWSVVSADDGHFTKGSYAFVVGKGAAPPSVAAESEVVQITTLPEVLGMTVELFGNGVLWATLLLFLFAVRPLMRSGKYESERGLVAKGYASFLFFAVALALVGGAFQLFVKAGDLAALQNITLAAALPVYAGTAAGSATVLRMLAVVGVLVVVVLGRAKIPLAARATVYEYLMLALMCCFAYLRAKISHATANPFYPELSIGVNFLHLIEKDIWAGLLAIVLAVVLVPRLRQFAAELVPKAFAMIALDLALVSVTACYIVWLHLKSFGNLLTTQWGSAFLQLLFAAVLLVGARLYHVLARLYAPKAFGRFLPATLAVEFALALLVVYASSTVIITSPPLAHPSAKEFSVQSEGAQISLANDPYEDGVVLLTVPGSLPVVTLSSGSARETITLAKRFDGGYVFPVALIPEGESMLEITAPQSGGYDAHASFSLAADDFTPKEGAPVRSFDSFALVMLIIAFAALAFSCGVYWLSTRSVSLDIARPRTYTPVFALLTLVLVASLVGQGMSALAASPLTNPFKAECTADGNMWHLMLPSKEGTAVSATPQEGCMWGMGAFMYMFPDKREYEYYRELPHAEVTLEHPDIVAGVPARLAFSVQNPDGTPANLFMDMEKRVHMVIVSEDETVFAHIHPDDDAPLPPEAIRTSSFSRTYTFPKAGKYLLSIDYANGITLESKQFVVSVAGAPTQKVATATYDSNGMFGGYAVSVTADRLTAGEVTTLRYTITKDGVPVTDILPYLGAPMHISVVKNDLTAFVHTHGEVHPPGTPYAPIIVKNGQVVHSMANMVMLDRYSSPIDAHLIFPTPGLYTVWGEFKVGSAVTATAFTLRVD